MTHSHHAAQDHADHQHSGHAHEHDHRPGGHVHAPASFGIAFAVGILLNTIFRKSDLNIQGEQAQKFKGQLRPSSWFGRAPVSESAATDSISSPKEQRTAIEPSRE